MKYAWIDAHRKELERVEMCEALAASASDYRAWKRGGTPERKRLTEAQMLALIRALHAEIKGAYGSPRITPERRARGFPASKGGVERLMHENGIRARHKRRYKATTGSKHSLPAAPNLLDRNFTPAAPNQAWTADLTPSGPMKAGVPGCRARSIQPGSDRLVDQAADDGRHRDRRAGHGLVPQETSTGADSSLRPWQPVCEPRL